MEEGRLLALSLAVSTIGLLLLVFLTIFQEPTPLSSITPEDIGSRVYVKGVAKGLRSSPEGHVFFTLTDDADGAVKIAVFKDVAKAVSCIEENRAVEIRGGVEEYRGEIEIIPSKAVDIKC